MMDALLSGILFGCTLALLVGPVFFALLQTSLHKGFRAGLYMVSGIALSDLVYILLAYFGLASFAQEPMFQMVLGTVGGSIMAIFGVVTLIKARGAKQDAATIDTRVSGWRLSLRAFALNGLNPFVILFWITTTSNVIGKYPGEPMQHAVFLTSMLVTAVGSDVAKAYGAKKLSKLITPKLMYGIALLVGWLLIIFGLRTVYTVWMGQ